MQLSPEQLHRAQQLYLFVQNNPRSVKNSILKGQLKSLVEEHPVPEGLLPPPEWLDDVKLRQEVIKSVQEQLHGLSKTPRGSPAPKTPTPRTPLRQPQTPQTPRTPLPARRQTEGASTTRQEVPIQEPNRPLLSTVATRTEALLQLLRQVRPPTSTAERQDESSVSPLVTPVPGQHATNPSPGPTAPETLEERSEPSTTLASDQNLTGSRHNSTNPTLAPERSSTNPGQSSTIPSVNPPILRPVNLRAQRLKQRQSQTISDKMAPFTPEQLDQLRELIRAERPPTPTSVDMDEVNRRIDEAVRRDRERRESPQANNENALMPATRPPNWRDSEVGFFHPDMDGQDGDVTTSGSDSVVTFRDVHLFVDRLKDAVAYRGEAMVRERIPSLLRGTAAIWYTTALDPVLKNGLRVSPIDSFYRSLVDQFRRPASESMSALTRQKYTLADAKDRRPIAQYVFNVVRHARDVGLDQTHQQLIFAYNGIDVLLRQSIPEPDAGLTMSEFIRRLDGFRENWTSLARLYSRGTTERANSGQFQRRGYSTNSNYKSNPY